MRPLIPTVFLLLSVFLFQSNARAQWTFMGGVVDSSRYFARAIETRGDTILVGGFKWGNQPLIWMSVDNGETWTISRQLLLGSVQCFGFHRDVLLAGGSFSIVRSTDGGKSWIKPATGLQADLTQGIITSFFSSGDKLFAGTRNGMGLSTDDGDNWSYISPSTFDGETTVFGFAQAGSKIFVATSKGIFKSANNGTDWAETGRDVTHSAPVGDILYHKDTLIADAYYSADQGDTWHEIPDVIFGDNWFGRVRVFDYAVKGDTVIAMAILVGDTYSSAALFSVDAGRTWTPHPAFDYFGQPLDIVDFDLPGYGRAIAANEKYFFAAALKDRSRVARSELGYDDWDEVGSFTATRFLSSNHKDVLYTSSSLPLGTIWGPVEWKSGNVYRSNDKGITWDHILNIPDAQIVELSVEPSIQALDNEIIFAVTDTIGGKRIYYSSTKGDEWKIVSNPSNARVTAITNGVSSWIVSDANLDHFRTIDQGDTWEKIDFGSFTDISRLLNTDGRLFAIACKEIITSTDGGLTWTLASESEHCLNRPDGWRERGEYYMSIAIHDNYLISAGYENVLSSTASNDLGAKLYMLPADFDNDVLEDEDNALLGKGAGANREFTTPIYTGTGFLSGNGLLFMPTAVIDIISNRKNENWESPNWYWRWTKFDAYPAFPSEHDDMVLMDGILYMESIGGIWSRPIDDLLSGITVAPFVTGIEDEPLVDKNIVYPNPVSDILFVDGSQIGEIAVNISIYDIMGNKVHSAQIDLSMTQATEEDVSSLAPGMYMAVIRSNDVIVSSKFVKN